MKKMFVRFMALVLLIISFNISAITTIRSTEDLLNHLKLSTKIKKIEHKVIKDITFQSSFEGTLELPYNTFENVTFEREVKNASMIGSKFNNCVFKDTVSDSSFNQAEFTETTFSKVIKIKFNDIQAKATEKKGTGITFNDAVTNASFVNDQPAKAEKKLVQNLTFKGPVTKTVFDSINLKDSVFEKAVIDTSFDHAKLTDVIFTENPDTITSSSLGKALKSNVIVNNKKLE